MNFTQKLKMIKNDILWNSIEKTKDFIPPKLTELLQNKLRNLRREDTKNLITTWIEKSINKDKKYIRWACAVCGAYIKNVTEWPKNTHFISEKCRNKHYNQIIIEEGSSINFRGQTSQIYSKTFLKNPKEMVK